MKTTYRTNDSSDTEFDDPISCQIYENFYSFLVAQCEESEWQNLRGIENGYDQTPCTLKESVIHRHLFKELMDQIDKSEAEL